MKRTRIGNLFGVPGFYISQPGDDVDNPTKSLLLDTRYETMNIHHVGQRRLNSEVISSLNLTRYYSLNEEVFPSLGYLPMYSLTILRADGGRIAMYPGGIAPSVYPFLNQFEFRIDNNNSIWLRFEVTNTANHPLDFMYIIYRNRWVG